MVKKLLKVRLMVLLVVALGVFDSSAWAQDAHAAQFPGFRAGQSGLGAVLGWPFGARYQKWLTWKDAMFFDLGYQTDGFFMFGGNYSFYMLSEDDRWRLDRRVGTILYNLFVGGVAGIHIGDSRSERERLGIRGGGAFEYLFPESDWALRVEVAPVLYLTGTTAAGLQGGIVLMKYFGKPENQFSRSPKAKQARPPKSKSSGDNEDWNF